MPPFGTVNWSGSWTKRALERGYSDTRHCQKFSSDTRHWGKKMPDTDTPSKRRKNRKNTFPNSLFGIVLNQKFSRLRRNFFLQQQEAQFSHHKAWAFALPPSLNRMDFIITNRNRFQSTAKIVFFDEYILGICTQFHLVLRFYFTKNTCHDFLLFSEQPATSCDVACVALCWVSVQGVLVTKFIILFWAYMEDHQKVLFWEVLPFWFR